MLLCAAHIEVYWPKRGNEDRIWVLVCCGGPPLPEDMESWWIGVSLRSFCESFIKIPNQKWPICSAFVTHKQSITSIYKVLAEILAADQWQTTHLSHRRSRLMEKWDGSIFTCEISDFHYLNTLPLIAFLVASKAKIDLCLLYSVCLHGYIF